MNSFQSFNQLTLPSPLLHALEKLGFNVPTPVQAETIPAVLDGRDILATAQTGTGKTGAFGIPLLSMLYRNPQNQALILVPTRELATQVSKVLHEMGKGLNLRGALIIGGESFTKQVSQLRGRCQFVVGTPGRINDHLLRKTFNPSSIQFLVLDEADRMLDMGFLPQLTKIVNLIPARRQTLLFSATLPTEITRLANTFLQDPMRIEIGTVSQPAPQVTEETIRTTDQGKNSVVLREISQRQGLILVFAKTKSRTDRLARLLYNEGHDVVALHGGRSQAQRKVAIQKFSTGRPRVMVATDLAGRGIDIANIEHVINYDVPSTREDYIHRIGRTGRAGNTGSALNLLVTGDLDGERVITGAKIPSRVVYRSSRRRFR